jgi:hypothetical protein
MNEIIIYSDESRHRGERFLLLGGLWIKARDIPAAEEEIRKIRKEHGYRNDSGRWVDFRGEFKWTKVSTKYLAIYKEIIGLFFRLFDQGKIRFCVMLIDTHNPAVQKYDNIKRDGYFKLLYQLYLHNCKVPGLYKIYPDKITNPQHKINLEKLRITLEKSLTKKFSELVPPENRPEQYIQAIMPVDSKKAQILQMVDVIIGAIGYFQNRHFQQSGAKRAKVELMKYVFDKLIYAGTIKIVGKKFLIARSTRFNIWLFRPKNKNNLP